MSRKAAVIGGFTKGMIVYKLRTWGNDAGTPDTGYTYMIRQLGPSCCTLDRVDPLTNQKYPYARGRKHYIHTQEEFLNRQRQYGAVAVYDYPYDWSHIFVAKGKDGWDSDF